MSFDWKEYESFARLLAGKDVPDSQLTKDARLRTAISRAYYASFNLACEFIEDYLQLKFKDTKSKSIHAKVIYEFSSDTDRDWKDIGADLGRLRDLRVNADYYKEMPKIVNETNLAIMYARNIIKKIDTLKE
jgi:uncharacterized protein (UPF0332 family)